MLTTTLPVFAVRTNVGTTAVYVNVANSEVLIGESDCIGKKRAVIDVLSGSGANLAATLRRLERRDEQYEAARDERGKELLA